jgi:hypothetical protein
MPAVKPTTTRQKATPRASGKLPPLKKPATPNPGYMTDEWYEYARDAILRTTPAQFRKELVEFGITDKNGKLTAPYRSV